MRLKFWVFYHLKTQCIQSQTLEKCMNELIIRRKMKRLTFSKQGCSLVDSSRMRSFSISGIVRVRLSIHALPDLSECARLVFPAGRRGQVCVCVCVCVCVSVREREKERERFWVEFGVRYCFICALSIALSVLYAYERSCSAFTFPFKGIFRPKNKTVITQSHIDS